EGYGGVPRHTRPLPSAKVTPGIGARRPRITGPTPWKDHMRTRRALPAATTAALLLAAATPAAGQTTDPDSLELTLLATTDVHGHVYDWDYFRNQPFPGPEAGEDADSLGLTRVATAVEQIRAEKGEDSVVLLDNGDAIQGTPLTYY